MIESVPTLALVGAKLQSVYNFSLVVTAIGAVLFAAGWLWIVFQMFRYSPLQGILAIVPVLAWWLAFFRLEHRQKSPWVTASVAGAAILGVGGILLYSNMVCDADEMCQPYTPPASGGESGGEGGESAEGEGESSAFIREYIVTTC